MRQVLLVIDMLNDFVREGGALEVPQTRRIIPALQSRLSQSRQHGIPVVYICDAHDADDREFERMGWPTHAVRGTEGAQVIAELAPAAGEDVVCKTTYSGFAGTDLDDVLQRLGAEELILTGCVTNICVLYTAADAVMRGYHVKVPADLVADLDETDGQFALAQMEKVLGVTVER